MTGDYYFFFCSFVMYVIEKKLKDLMSSPGDIIKSRSKFVACYI